KGWGEGFGAIKHVGLLQIKLLFLSFRNRLSVCNKLCYAVGGAPYQITGCALGFFLQIYLLDVAQLDPFYASIILFVGRAWDAVTDPTVGFLVSRSPWTRFGRMLPWILLSTPLAVLSYFLIWYVPPFEDGKVIWYLVFYCLFQTLQTVSTTLKRALASVVSPPQEQKESCRPRSEPMSFFQGIKLVMGHGPYAKLVMGFLFTSLAFMLLEGNFALFCSSTLGFRNDFQNILLVIMLSASLTIPFWQWFLTRFGKKTAIFVGTLSVVPFMILVVCLKSNLIVTYVVSFAAGVGVAAAFLLPWSMLPDVVDDFQVQNPNSTGHEALFYSFYVFFTKFASGVSLGISTLSLDFAGYISRGCSQPEEVHLTLKLLVSAAPVGLIIIGLVILYFYPIDEERRQGNRKLLQEQRDNETDSETESTELANIA
uniref:MFSD2 lysolipid transporter A, lysophospholipid b n=1 Tax=Scophthalmus maximus TaxID=52904 RepID=A0A8D3CAP9_SCOMX